MVKSKNWKIYFILIQIIVGISASTHWIVTENGRIQSHLDSPFHLRRPYDLLGLLDQELRISKIDTLYQDLVLRKSVIDKKWSGLEGASDLEARIYSQDIDCLKAGKSLSEIDLYTSIATDGSDRDGIRLADFLIEDITTPDGLIVPDCRQAVQLDFSMFAFEHLSAMVNRVNLSIAPENALEQWLQPGTTVATFGHQVALGLLRNNTSWLHHNLGAIYWRIKGEAYNAVECGRRAVHFAPREFRDIALLNLASIFHQARYPGEAAIILHAAVDHAPHQPAHHFALGNVYAVLADYNRSVACYDNFLKLRPGIPEALTTRHATLCHRKLKKGLMDLQESLQGILTELHDYHSQQEQWLRLQERLMWEQTQLEAKLVAYNPETFSAMLANRGQSCMQRGTGEDGKPSVLSCDLNTDHQMMAHNLQIDISLSLQMLLRNVETQALKISEQMAKGKRYVKQIVPAKRKEPLQQPKLISNINSLNVHTDEVVIAPSRAAKYPKFMMIAVTKHDFEQSDWPSKQLCLQWKFGSNLKDIFLPVFLPPENKGFEITKMLSDSIGLLSGTEHALPWYPPVCQVPEQSKQTEKTYFPTALLRNGLNTPLTQHSYLQSQLLNYINGGKVSEAEIGQRIITAIQKKAGPGWLLATLASLYWRVRTNTRNTVNCLNLAVHTVPEDYKDVVLVSISSVLQELGYVDDALKIALEAYSINNVEPTTNFLLGLLYNQKNNQRMANYYLRQTLRLELEFYDKQAERLLRTWGCKKYFVEEVSSKGEFKDGMCAEKETTMRGEGVICSAGGEQCKAAAIQCYRTENIPDDSDVQTITKLLAGEPCAKRKPSLGHSLLSTLLASNGGSDYSSGVLEGSGNLEPDQSQLESMTDHQQAFHMRISLGGDENSPVSTNSLGDFYVSVSLTDDPTPEAMLYVYDKSGTYPLSPKGCRVIKDADWLQFSSMWQSIATRNMDIGPMLKPLPANQEPLKPHCDVSLPPSPTTLDHLTAMRLRYHRLVSNEEPTLVEWLRLMAGDQRASLRDLGTRIAIALQENTTSWILATAAALYWRSLGQTDEAVTCLRQALTYAPTDVRDIPLVNLANVLHRVGFHSDALDVAYLALETQPNFVVNHFTVGNIQTSLGDLEKAISFYRSSLALDANFEPARNRLQAILCTLLFDETGSLRESTDNIPDN